MNQNPTARHECLLVAATTGPLPWAIPPPPLSTEEAAVSIVVSKFVRLASGQVSRRSQGTLLPSSGEPKVSNPWNKCVTQETI
jgi:hypothetical protein